MSEDIKKALSKFRLEDYDSPAAFRAAAAKAGLTEAQIAEAIERIKSVELSDQELSSIVGGFSAPGIGMPGKPSICKTDNATRFGGPLEIVIV